ncbi:MAG: phosphatidylserine decarboxylase family protein [Symbiobacteriia bacterium]
MRHLPIAREGLPYLLVLALVTLLAFAWTAWAGIVGLALLGFVAFFFRDPEREVPQNDVLVAPADGRVMSVSRAYEPRYLQGEAQVVTIFLSIFNVHINRAPVAGRVAYREYVPGKYLVAYAEKASEINERNYLGLESVNGLRYLVVQIAGLVARRIVCWPQVGDQLATGERFGLIKFGSCTQVYLPATAEVTVRPGDTVRGGLTVIGRNRS